MTFDRAEFHPMRTLMAAIEGGDAMGKNTQTRKLAARIGGTAFSSPDYKSPSGILIAKTWDEFYVRQSLFCVNRYESAVDVMAAHEHGPVVHDRYYLSSVVYGTVEGLDEEWLWRIHARLPQPRVHILLDASVEESFKRRPERRDPNEENREKLQNVRREYLRVFSEKGPARRLTTRVRGEGEVPVHFLIVDGNGTVDEVHDRIWDALCGTLGIS